MSTKQSLIKQLYEQAMGKQTVVEPTATRLVSSTNTLMNNAVPVTPSVQKKLPEDIPLESHEYEATINRKKNLLVTNKKPILPGDQIRIIETKGLVPTGRSITKTVRDVIVGTTENGICAGKIVFSLQDVTW